MTLDNANFLNLLFLFFSAFILLIVYYLELFLGVEPCKLCIYQRFPYFIAILLATSFLLIKNQKFKKLTFLFFILIFFSSLIMSVHHFGIEKNLWNALSSCEANNKILTNSADLKEYLLNKDYVSCKDVSFKFLEISLAGYNIIVSFVLFTLSIIGFRKLKN
jgi:disulfide bond formation protein DsbB